MLHAHGVTQDDKLSLLLLLGQRQTWSPRWAQAGCCRHRLSRRQDIPRFFLFVQGHGYFEILHWLHLIQASGINDVLFACHLCL